MFNFFKKNKKSEYKSLIEEELTKCDLCENLLNNLELHKCENCNQKKLCKECVTIEKLCKHCNIDYMNFCKQLQLAKERSMLEQYKKL